MIALAAVALLGCIGYLVNLSRTFKPNSFGIEIGRVAESEANRIGAGIAALGLVGQRSLVDSTLPYPIWYPTNDGSGELSRLLPYWSTDARALGEPARSASTRRVSAKVGHLPPGSAGTQYVHLIVQAPAATTMIVRIAAVDPTQPELPWRIRISPGTGYFTLAAWSTAVRSVTVHGDHVKALSIRSGAITLASPVSRGFR